MEQNSAWGNQQYLADVVAAVIEYSGVRPMIYGMASNYAMLQAVGNRYDCGLWVAQYANMNPTGYQQDPWNQGAYACCMRQYTSTGRLPGYNGNLDLDKFYGDASAWRKYAATIGSAPVSEEEVPVVRPQMQVPTPAPVVENVATQNPVKYTVRGGDTLSGIAQKFGTTYQHLANINNIKDPNRIYPGEILNISGNGTLSRPTTYKIQPGDTLSSIAAKFGTTYQYLANINGIKDPNKIYAGEIIMI